MATPFARSLRSLNVDSLYPSLVGLLVVMLLLAVWSLWFFGAEISLYQTSETAEVSGVLGVTARFAPAQTSQMKIGQTATFYPSGAVLDQTGPIPAIVTDVRQGTGDQTEVRLALRPEQRLIEPLPDGLIGRVEIETERISPAAYTLSRGGLGAPAPASNPEAN